jgi:integrase
LVLADNGGERSGNRAAPTVKEMGDALIARMRRDDLKRSHIETASGHLRKHINPMLGDMLVSEVVESDTERLVTRLTNAGLAPKTIRNYIGTFHSVMGLAVRGRHIERNPAAMAELPKVRKSKRLRFLNHDELNRVVSTPLPESDQELVAAFPPSRKKDRTSEFGGPQAVRDWWPVLRMMILLAAMTGMRLGELRALRWSDIDYRAMKIRVRREYVRGQYDKPKSLGSERGIPLAARLVTELDEHHQRTVWNQDSDLVLAHPHTGRPLDHARIGLHYHAALVRADVRRIRVHDLRHTFGTTMAASGKVSLRTLQEWMGHEDIRTTQIYADYMPAERESELIDDAFAPRTIRGPIFAKEPLRDPLERL